MKQKPDPWALLLIAFALIALVGSGLAVIAWWVWKVLEMTR